MTTREQTPPSDVLRTLARTASELTPAELSAAGWQPTAARGRRVAAAVAGTADLPDDLVTAITTLATPAETLLLLGGDDRVIPRDGINTYGFPPSDPAPVALLSSCTASPPGRSDLDVVDQWRTEVLDQLLGSHRSLTPAQWRAPVVAAIAEVLGLPADDARRLVLTPSGTDAEAVVAAIAVYSHGRPLVNVVVGALESGSGTLRAAAGCGTTAVTPLGGAATVGESLAGLGPDLVRVVDVDVRDARGRARRPFDVEAEVEAHVEAALHDGATVVVHAMECSKTGLTYLDPDWAATWRSRYPATLRVVVDAAQTRISNGRLRAFLAAGASVVATGSKALSGAPFSGVLILDDALLSDAASCERLPSGLAALLSAADLPDELARLAAGWEPVNLGLLARWQTAIAQRRNYLEISGDDRRVWHDLVVGELRGGLARLDNVELLEPTNPSIVSFTVSGAAGPLSREPLTQLQHDLAAAGIYLGQPAELASGGPAVLRAAIGDATLTTAAAGDGANLLREVAAATVAALRGELSRSHVS